MITKNKIRNIVVDTTFLDAMYRLDLLDKLVLLYSRVYMPENVEKEFLSEQNPDRNDRFNYLVKYEKCIWFRKCNSYDKGIMDILVTNETMHKGESEVIAQTKQLGLEELPEDSLFAVLDDKKARDAAENMSIKKIGTLRVLAMFHHLLNIINYFEVVEILIEQGAKFSKKVIDLVFEDVQKEVFGGGIYEMLED